MADGADILTFPRVAMPRPFMRLVDSPVKPQPKRAASFTYCEATKQVFVGTAPLSEEAVVGLLRLFDREANRTGDWSLYDELLSARDGINEPPLGAA